MYIFLAQQLNEDKLITTMIGDSKFPNKNHIQFWSFEILRGLFWKPQNNADINYPI